MTAEKQRRATIVYRNWCNCAGLFMYAVQIVRRCHGVVDIYTHSCFGTSPNDEHAIFIRCNDGAFGVRILGEEVGDACGVWMILEMPHLLHATSDSRIRYVARLVGGT